MSSARNLVFTLNNYTQQEYDAILRWKCSYLVVGKEIGQEGTPHLQGYVEWGRSVRFTTLKKLNERIHWEKRMGTAKQASDYCKKDKDFVEVGEMSNQGERSDLNEVKESILQGTKVDDIVLSNPNLYHQYGRTLNKIEDLAMRKKYRTTMTQGIWYHGPTGVGKSHKAFEGFTPETHYVLPNDNGWWDGYTQQKYVIINDFRGHIPYNELLQMVDKFPFSVKRRNREPMPFTSEYVIITSSLRPQTIYHNRNSEDNIAQLHRRFQIIDMTPILEPCGVAEVVEGNTNTSTDTDPELEAYLQQ